MRKIEELWEKLKDVELIQIRPVEMEAMYKHCFEFQTPQIVEIGSAHGASSIILAEAAQELLGGLICIDHFPENYYGQEKFGSYAKRKFIKNMKPYSFSMRLIDEPSELAIEEVRRTVDHIDVLFIDGNHDYPAVKKDCELYLPLVGKGGYIGFHDYNNVAFGVQKAVDEVSGIEKVGSYWDLAVYKKL